MIRYFIQVIFVIIIFPLSSAAQTGKVISLKICLTKAEQNFPLLKKDLYNQKQLQLEKKIISSNYYPSININGRASYQSEVTQIPALPLPGVNIPVISNDFYNLNLNLEQLIWDGGRTKKLSDIKENEYKIDIQKNKIRLYDLKKRISIMYFNILFLKENIKTLKLLVSDLKARIADGKAAVRNGVILASGLDKLKVGLMQTQQIIYSKNSDLKGLIESLNALTGMKLSVNDSMASPDMNISVFPMNNNRPEYHLLTMQQQQIKSYNSLNRKKRMPVLKLFGQAGYGRPGYNMLNNNFSSYYMVGVQLNWKLWNKGNVKKQQHIFTLEQNKIQVEKENFNYNLNAVYRQQLESIKKFQSLLDADKKIIAIQNKITQTSQNQLKNGTITASEYLIQLNKKIKAVLTMKAHKLQLLFAKNQYITTMGKL